MRRTPATRFDSDESGFVPLWRERSFLLTLPLLGVAAAAVPVAAKSAPAAWPAAAVALLGFLAAADLGAVAPAADARAVTARGLRFAAVAAVVPLLLGLGATAAGVAPGRWLALLLLGAGALLALAAIAPLESAQGPDDDLPARPRGGRAIAAAGAALSLATASLWQSAVSDAQRLAPGVTLSWVAAALVVALAAGAVVAAAGLVGGAALRRLRYRSFHGPRAAAAALLLAASGGIAAAGLAWL